MTARAEDLIAGRASDGAIGFSEGRERSLEKKEGEEAIVSDDDDDDDTIGVYFGGYEWATFISLQFSILYCKNLLCHQSHSCLFLPAIFSDNSFWHTNKFQKGK